MKYIVFIFIIISVSLFAQEDKKYIRKGNKNYEDGNYQDSEISYRKAIDKNSASYKASFNLGDALFKQKKFKDAISQFKSVENKDIKKEDKAKVYHNIGNSYLESGDIEKSIEAYKNALRNNPKDMETKYNLAYAKHLLKKQQKQKQKQQNKQNQDKKQDKQDKQKQQKQQNNDKQEEQKQQQQQQQKKKISKEDAERMLKAMENDEKKVQKKLQKQQGQKVNVEKNW